MKPSPREQVLECYPQAEVKKEGVRQWYIVYSCRGYILGQGQSKKAAWKAASRNINN